MGYYRDVGSAAAAAAAEADVFRASLDESGGGDDADDSPDAPILAALGSHRGGIDRAESACKRLEDEAKGWGGRVPSGLRHQAEVVEVTLTDQLLQLTRMLDDCATADGRSAVKGAIARLKGVGARLLKISQGGR